MALLSFCSRAVAGLIVFAFAAACDTPTAPSRIPTTPTQTIAEPGPNPPDLAGTYTMTLTASSRCRLSLPESVRTSAYPATIAQAGSSLTVRLESPDDLYWGTFRGTVSDNDRAEFELFIWEDRAGVEFAASGVLTATVLPGELSGFLDGYLYGDGARCTAQDHAVRFSR
jgi:hypothetical protein